MFKCNLYKNLGAIQLSINLELDADKLMVVLGQSGCGKSSFLNLIAGFTKPDKGSAILNNQVLYNHEQDVSRPIHKRHIGYIQQESCLFPHLTVKENILYGVTKKKRKQVLETYQELIRTLGIQDLEDAYPTHISGGQQQRVAIGRVLMTEPKMILWDEPFSALDHIIRDELRGLVDQLKKRYSIPMLFVTHDLGEAYQLGDDIAVMSQGEIQQVGRREEVFHRPINMEVARTIGVTNFIKGIKMEEDTYRCNRIILKVKEQSETSIEACYLGIRPENILYVREEEIEPKACKEIGNIFLATVLNIRKHLESYLLTIKISGLDNTLQMRMPTAVWQRYEIEVGMQIRVLLKYKSLIVLGE